MQKLKVNFHLHTKEDPIDSIKHSERELIKEAARLGYDVLSITCHDAVIFNDDLKKYAESKQILLIPGIEKTIERKHVLIINAKVEAQFIKNFADLAIYKNKHPECLIIAPHPYYPRVISLRKKLEENIHAFDAIEYSWFHGKKLNSYNLKAVKMAEKHKLPVLATSDNHLLSYLDQGYSLVESEKNVEAIFKAIKANKIKIVSHNLSLWQLISTYLIMEFRYRMKQFWLK